MSEEKFQEALRLVSALSLAERKRLRILLGELPGSQQVTTDRSRNGNALSPVEKSDWLLSGILAELKRRGLSYPPQLVSHVVAENTTYRDNSSFIRKEIETCLKLSVKPLRQAHLDAMGETVARCLAGYLSSVTSPTLKIMLNNVSKAMEALDRSFPGYLYSGMIGVLVQRTELAPRA